MNGVPTQSVELNATLRMRPQLQQQLLLQCVSQKPLQRMCASRQLLYRNEGTLNMLQNSHRCLHNLTPS